MLTLVQNLIHITFLAKLHRNQLLCGGGGPATNRQPTNETDLALAEKKKPGGDMCAALSATTCV